MSSDRRGPLHGCQATGTSHCRRNLPCRSATLPASGRRLPGWLVGSARGPLRGHPLAGARPDYAAGRVGTAGASGARRGQTAGGSQRLAEQLWRGKAARLLSPASRLRLSNGCERLGAEAGTGKRGLARAVWLLDRWDGARGPGGAGPDRPMPLRWLRGDRRHWQDGCGTELA